MINLNEKALVKTRKSDTVCILGSGFSINTISPFEWDFIRKNDSFSFNWFCLGDAPIIPKYYMLHCQGCDMSDSNTRYTFDNFLEWLKCEHVVFLKHKKSNKPPIPIDIGDNLHRIDKPGSCFVSGGENIDLLKQSPFDGAYNPPPALGFVLHIALWLGYKNIVLFGIDLYDSRYYWSKYNETWDLLRAKHGSSKVTRFIHADETVEMIKKIVYMFPAINFSVHNPKSLLREVIPLWALDS